MVGMTGGNWRALWRRRTGVGRRVCGGRWHRRRTAARRTTEAPPPLLHFLSPSLPTPSPFLQCGFGGGPSGEVCGGGVTGEEGCGGGGGCSDGEGGGDSGGLDGEDGSDSGAFVREDRSGEGRHFHPSASSLSLGGTAVTAGRKGNGQGSNCMKGNRHLRRRRPLGPPPPPRPATRACVHVRERACAGAVSCARSSLRLHHRLPGLPLPTPPPADRLICLHLRSRLPQRVHWRERG